LNADLQVISPSDSKILKKWHDGTYHSPVKIVEIEGKGKGVVACMNIMKNEFITEYSGDIIPVSFKLN
jgi:SET domain-containing protein